MSSMIFFLILVCIIAILFLVLSLVLAPHNFYAEKVSSFECGFHSFLGQNRTPFTILFFIYALVFLILDLEITLVYPFAVSQTFNEIYGFTVVVIFMFLITIGFVFELAIGALKIESKQNIKLPLRKAKRRVYASYTNNRRVGLFSPN